MMKELFKEAKAIFLEDAGGANVQAGFIKRISCMGAGRGVKVRVTAGTVYRLYVNGELAGHGPARTAEGYARVDELDVSRFVNGVQDDFAFEVVYYGLPYGEYSNDVARGSAFLMAEIADGKSGEVLAASGPDWNAIRLNQRAELSERISHCRENAEVYSLDPLYTEWRTAPDKCTAPVCTVCPSVILLERGMALPALTRRKEGLIVDAGEAVLDRKAEVPDEWFYGNLQDYIKKLEERPLLEYRRTREIGSEGSISMKIDADGTLQACFDPKKTLYVHYDTGKNLLGFIKIDIEVSKKCILDIIHLENYVYYDGKCEVTGGANPVTRLRLCPGKTSFITMEPAVFRYLKLYVRPWAKPGARPVSATGAEPLQVRIGMPESIEYMCPDTHAGSFQCSDDDVNRLYAAARQTLRMNTLDIFMDCPERERGGWLCDSLWTARAFRMMMGHSGTEKAFIENFLLTPADSMWHGFFPEVYPAVKPNFNECPGLLTWSFWLMEELCEYVRRSGDMEFALKYKKRVAAFVHGSLELRGESGLMENMPWVFIDWSCSNDFCRPISTAANALYARVLLDLGELYGEPGWAEEGAKIRSILRKTLCKNDKKPVEPGGFLPDALEYRDGQLHRCGNYSESGQYTMLWAGLFTRDELPDYFWRVIHTSGPAREYPGDNKLGSANLFIGLCIRLDLLARLGEYEILLRELKAIYYPQLREGPGTLWEVTDVVNTSRCHGFSAHAGVQLMRDILGIGEPDELTRTVKIEPHPCGLRWARGVVQTPEGLITLFWTNKDGKLDMKLTLPEGWRAV